MKKLPNIQLILPTKIRGFLSSTTIIFNMLNENNRLNNKDEIVILDEHELAMIQ